MGLSVTLGLILSVLVFYCDCFSRQRWRPWLRKAMVVPGAKEDNIEASVEVLFEDVGSRSATQTNNDLNTALRSCVDGRLVDGVKDVAELMLTRNVSCSPQTMTLVLTLLLENHDRIVETKRFYEAFVEKGLVCPSIHHFSPLIRVSSSPDEVLALLRRMDHFGLEPNVFTFTSAIASCDSTGDWGSACKFLEMMESSGVRPNQVTYSCLISVAAKNMSHVIYDLVCEMPKKMGENANLVCYSKALTMCARARLYPDVEKLLNDMVVNQVEPETGTFLGILASYKNLAKEGIEDWSELRLAAISLIERWAGAPFVDETVYVSVMDLLDAMEFSADVMHIYDLARNKGNIITKSTLRYSFRALTKMQDLDRAEDLLEDARMSGLATARMYNSTMLMADTIGRHDVALDLLLSLVRDSSDGLSATLPKGRRIRPPQRFVRSRIISNALLSLSTHFSSAFVEGGRGHLEPSGEVADIHDALVQLLPTEACGERYANRVLLRPGAYPMATKVLLDAKDFYSLRILLNQTMYMSTVNSTKLYEFSVKGLTLAFPLHDGVRTILGLIQDCVDAGAVNLGAEMLTLAMNRIFNVPSLPRSSIDRTFLNPDWAGRGAPVRFQRQKPMRSSRKGEGQHKSKGMRSDTRERLLILMHMRARSVLGADSMPPKSYRLAALACQNALLFDKALDIYQQATEDEKLDTFTMNVIVGTLSRSEDFWETALEIFEDANVRDAYGYVAALVACETGGDWEHALFLLDRAREDGLQWSTSMVTTAIAACGSRGRADEALRLLEQSAADRVPLNTVAFNAAIFACVGHHLGEPRWQEAEELVEFMVEHKVWPNRVTYNALIEALGESGEVDKADSWYLDAVTANVLSPFKELARYGWVDLHLHSVHMARSAVRMTFQTLRALHIQDGVPNEGEIVFIVGKGRKLLQAIHQQLEQDFDPPIRCHVRSSNLGRLLLNKEDVINYLERGRRHDES